MDYGRFAAAATWYKKLTGRNVNSKIFIQMNKEFDINLVDLILENVV